MKGGIAIIDYGSQYTQLIARRVRELGVYSAIHGPRTTAAELVSQDPSGIILSGGPQSVYAEGAPGLDPAILDLDLPVLGICYGMQLLTHLGGGRVVPGTTREYGRAEIRCEIGLLFQGLPELQAVWMSHGDRVETLPAGYRSVARTADGVLAAAEDALHRRFALQFHPEVTHTPGGRAILSNFLDFCGCARTWTMANYLETLSDEVRAQVGHHPVLVLVSGGVDSTVTAALLVKALGPDQVHALHVDSGLMRSNESAAVVEALRAAGLENLRFVDASARFLSALCGLTDPEAKRRAIGDTFIEVQAAELSAMGLPEDVYLAQGTLYTDLIESGLGVGNQADLIKTHHNVGTPLVRELRERGRLVEPNREIFKDEVRELGKALGLPEELVLRHPFPGPGLGIRVLGEVTPERLALLRKVDDIFLEELRRAGLYGAIWQAFAVLLPVRTVGVMGDGRTYQQVAALRAVSSVDGMTAEAYPLPHDLLFRVASRVPNEVPGVSRVVYDLSSKPPGTIEWE